MKARITVIAVALALVLAAGIAVSQTVGKSAYHQGFGGGFEHHMMRMMSRELALTDAQKGQMKQLFASEKPTMQPLMQQLHQSELQLRQLETSGNFDEAKAREIASQQAQTMTELTVERAKLHAQIFNLLTAEQKTKAIELLNQHEQRFQQHMQKMQQNQAPAQPQ